MCKSMGRPTRRIGVSDQEIKQVGVENEMWSNKKVGGVEVRSSNFFFSGQRTARQAGRAGLTGLAGVIWEPEYDSKKIVRSHRF